MINYIAADLKRIFTRIPRLVTIAVYYVAFILFVWMMSTQSTLNSVIYQNIVEQFLQSTVPIVLGIIEMAAVFSDDFKAKTMQVAIGIGIKRWQVVLCKFIEVVILVLADLLVLGVLIFILAGAFHTGLSSSQVSEIVATLFVNWITVLAYMSLTMILIFYQQSTGVAILLYLLFTTHMVVQIFSMLFSVKAIAGLHLSNLLLTNLISVFKARLILGIFGFPSFLGILLYIAAGIALSALVFEKRELEF